MAQIINENNRYRVFGDESISISDRLPTGIYTVGATQAGLHLDLLHNTFTIPSRLYGETLSNSSRIIRTFNDRPASTGIILTGEKGSGKTLLAKQIANELLLNGIPTILVNSPFASDEFIQMINNIDQEIVVVFDEFEKVYDEQEEQSKLLTLFDGVFKKKRLFILTCNSVYNINPFIFNRPGRFYYSLSFDNMSTTAITEYIDENLKVDRKEELLDVINFLPSINFDVLQALVEEINRFNCSPKEAISFLNIDTNTFRGIYYVSKVISPDGKDITALIDKSRTRFDGNPTDTGDARIYVYTIDGDALDKAAKSIGISSKKELNKIIDVLDSEFVETSTDLVRVQDTKTFIYKTSNNYEITLSERVSSVYNHFSF